MSGTKQGKHLRKIGWLMLAGLLLLLLFMGEWLRSQYSRQQQRLDQDVKTTLTLTTTGLRDSLFQNIFSFLLDKDDSAANSLGNQQITIRYDETYQPDGNSSPGKKIKIRHSVQAGNKMPAPPNVQLHSNGTTIIRLDASGRGVPVATQRSETSPGHIINMSRRSVIPRKTVDSAMLLKELQQNKGTLIGLNTTKDTLTTFSFEGKLIKIPLNRMLHMPRDQTEETFFNPGTASDSAMLLRKFQEALDKKQPGLLAHWDTSRAAAGQPFHYGQADSLSAKFVVNGWRPILVRSLLPQLAFSVFLLLVIGAAFGLAYRTMKRQAQFNQQKDSFISNISHELKTPVSITKVALEALTTYQGLEDPARARKYLDVAQWEINRLGNMIERVMNTVQAGNGTIQLIPGPVQPAALVEEIVQNLQPIFREKGVIVSWHAEAPQTEIPGDKLHLQGTIYNLLDNALKYGGKQISISQTVDQRQLQLAVSDNGPGIAADYQQKVFESFFRVPSGNRHDVKGYGLGLSYACDIIKAHNGTLRLVSPPGEGATFIITLPINATL